MNESPREHAPTSRKDRLIDLITRLRDGELHRAADLARDLGVSDRTLYRDMVTLKKSGVPVTGARGLGYYMTDPVTLPPLNLSLAELEALHLGLAVMCEASDPDLRASARSLAAKIDDSLPEDGTADATGWGLAVFPFADTAAGIRHIPAIRRAIRGRRKLRLTYRSADGAPVDAVVHPLKLEFWGRVWTATLWSEQESAPILLRVDRISAVVELSAEFGKTAGVQG